jgi:Smg protein
MKENILEVLMYLFENYMIEDSELQPDRADLEHELTSMGFTNGEIGKAFNWLEDLSELCDVNQNDENTKSIYAYRHYTSHETLKINVEVQGVLLLLEQSGMINSKIREIIIDRIMALDIEDNDTDNAKWVIMMVLCNIDSTDSTLELAEELVFDGISAERH